MSYKSILVQLDHDKQCLQRIKVAVDLALRFDAHLTGLATIGRFEIPAPLGYEPMLAYHEQVIEQMRLSAKLAAKDFVDYVKATGLRSFESQVEEGNPVDCVSIHARYSDLLILGQMGENTLQIGTPEDLPEGVLLSAARPIIYVPYAGEYQGIGKEIMVLWNGSREAARAAHDALPLMQQAKKVHIACFDAKANSHGYSGEPGSDIAQYLSHHGIKADITRSTSQGNVGEAALSLAADLNVDLIVMGGYGHSRVRELLLGGATKTLLKSMTVPVLMSH
jgi:nucleotide-binding universal stress UspA family protein